MCILEFGLCEIVDFGVGVGNVIRLIRECWLEVYVIGVEGFVEMVLVGCKVVFDVDWVYEDFGVWWLVNLYDLIYFNVVLYWLLYYEVLFLFVMEKVNFGGLFVV